MPRSSSPGRGATRVLLYRLTYRVDDQAPRPRPQPRPRRRTPPPVVGGTDHRTPPLVTRTTSRHPRRAPSSASQCSVDDAVVLGSPDRGFPGRPGANTRTGEQPSAGLARLPRGEVRRCLSNGAGPGPVPGQRYAVEMRTAPPGVRIKGAGSNPGRTSPRRVASPSGVSGPLPLRHRRGAWR